MSKNRNNHGKMPWRMVTAALILIVSIVVILFALYRGPAGKGLTANNGLTVAVSFNPIYYLVKPVVGNHAHVLQIISPGVEPHDYEPTPSDVANMSNGSVLFYDGPALESWAVGLVQAINKNIELVPLIDSINESKLGYNTSIKVQDPHFWLDPALMPGVVKDIESRMMRLDPANAVDYAANADSFIAELNQLNISYGTGLAHCKSRTIIDSHAFLGYLAISYNFTELPVGGENPDAEVSPQHVAAVINEGIKDHAKAVFQESADPTVAVDQNIAEAINGSIYKIYTMEVLTPGQLAGGANYTSLMYQNLNTLEQGLNCTPN